MIKWSSQGCGLVVNEVVFKIQWRQKKQYVILVVVCESWPGHHGHQKKKKQSLDYNSA